MGAVWFRARAEFRSGWRGALAVALLAGIAGAGVMAAAAGARRTDSAYARFLGSTATPDATVAMYAWLPIGQVEPAAIMSLPAVERGAIASLFMATPQDPVTSDRTGGLVPHGEEAQLPIVTSQDPAFGRDIARLRVLEGREPDPAAPDEVIAGFSVARDLGWEVGSAVRVTFAPFFDDEGPATEPSPSMTMRVVGIAAAPDDFPPRRGDIPIAFTLRGTPALHRALARQPDLVSILVAIEGGAAGLPRFQEELSGLVPGAGTFIFTEHDHSQQVQRSMRVHSVALWLVAAVLAAAGSLVVGQALARHLFMEAADHPPLRAIGLSPGQLWALGMARALTVAGAGAAAAVLVAVSLSPLTPVGVARAAEPSPGIAADWTVLGFGALGIVALLAGAAAWPAWRAARFARSGRALERGAARERPSAVGAMVTRSGLPPDAVAGIRMALEPGRGRTAVPVRSTLVAVGVGIAALVAALTFGASLAHLLDSPRLFGWSIDASTADFDRPPTHLRPALDADPRIEGYEFSTGPVPLSVAGVRVDAFMMDGRGSTMTLLAGRMPREGDEIVLGSETLRRIGRRIGEAVAVHLQGQPERVRDLTIVGRAVLPPLGPTLDLGRGAIVPASVGRILFGADAVEQGAANLSELSVRFVPGTDIDQAVDDLRRLHPAFVRAEPVRPDDLANYGRVEGVPLVLAGILAVLAAAALAHTLVTAVRRRRRDLAILKSIGFARAQVRRTVAWQSSATASAALVVAIPVGIGAGRAAWTVFAERLGVVPESAMALGPVLWLVPAALLLALFVSALPARAAARTRPALVLRTE